MNLIHRQGSCHEGTSSSSIGIRDYIVSTRANALRDLVSELEIWENREIDLDRDSGLSIRIVALQDIVNNLLDQAFPEGRPPADGVPTTGVSAPPTS